VTEQLGEPIETGVPSLDRLGLTLDRTADGNAQFLSAVGVPTARAKGLIAVAAAIADGALRLEPGAEVPYTMRALTEMPGVDARTATAIVMRALHWPDALPAGDPVLQRAAQVSGTAAMRRMAERWRPWRSYAAAHLALDQAGSPAGT